MVQYVSGDLFASPAQTLVNTVNTVGVMGKGIALTFKKVFPQMFREYQQLCEQRKLEVGTLHIWRSESKIVLNFPTKKHWRNPSELEYIEAGLATFVRVYERAGIHSVAFPPLGCGNGELDFREVRSLMERYLDPLPIPVFIYTPHRKVSVPEHRTPREITAWLHDNPADQPFSLVWEELLTAFRQARELETLSKGGRFEVEIADNGDALRVRSPGRTTKVHRDEFWDLWRQLREYGMISAASVPANRANVASHLLAILYTLPYVGIVPVGDDYLDFQLTPTLALQLIPPAEKRSHQAELSLS